MRIQIIGGSGTGKSSLAKYMSENEAIKWIDMDAFLWKNHNFTENNSIERRQELNQMDIETRSSYVVSGSIFMWRSDGFNNRDLLIFLSLDEESRMERLRTREMKRQTTGKMWLDENGTATNDFLEWCKTYWAADDISMTGTYVEQAYQMENSQSPVLKMADLNHWKSCIVKFWSN